LIVKQLKFYIKSIFLYNFFHSAPSGDKIVKNIPAKIIFFI